MIKDKKIICLFGLYPDKITVRSGARTWIFTCRIILNFEHCSHVFVKVVSERFLLVMKRCYITYLYLLDVLKKTFPIQLVTEETHFSMVNHCDFPGIGWWIRNGRTEEERLTDGFLSHYNSKHELSTDDDLLENLTHKYRIGRARIAYIYILSNFHFHYPTLHRAEVTQRAIFSSLAEG